MNRIKTKAYLEVTLEQAREWYESGNEDLKKLALTAFSEEMLIPSFKEIVESEEDYGFWNTSSKHDRTTQFSSQFTNSC